MADGNYQSSFVTADLNIKSNYNNFSRPSAEHGS